MGNNAASNSYPSNSKTEGMNSQQITQLYEQSLSSLSRWCTDNEYPLRMFRGPGDVPSRHRIIEIVSSPRKSDEFSSLLVKLIWNNQPSLPKEEIVKIFRDCCLFDLKQAFTSNHQVEMSTLDNDCFLALTNNICTVDNATVGEEQFYQWIRVHFPTLFYGFELWLRQHSVSSATGGYTAEKTLASTRSLMPMDNILNPTWIWLLTHHLPMLYLSADITCTNLFERMTSVLFGQMWDHLYDSHRDGASMNRFQHHIFGYKAPTITLLEVSDGYLFGLCCDEEFRESPKHFGGIQSCLVQLKPVFKIILEGPSIIFMNTKSRGISALGLFIGRDHAHTFLNIDSDFFNVKHLNGEGRLVAIDVWGVGGRASADEQSSMRQWEDKQVEKSRKVKRSYEDEEAILNMAGIETRRRQEQL